MSAVRQLLWTLVFLADRGEDEARPLGLAVIAAAGIGACAWWLLSR